MNAPHHETQKGSYSTPPKKPRRFSVWTLLAPAAVVILWISFFSALNQSCILKECPKKDTSTKTNDTEDKRNDLPQGTKTKVKAGDTIGSIAAKFHLTEEELKACNSKADPQTLQPGQYLTVSAVDCEEADRAKTGANPDPLSGDTTTGAKAPPNGTAATDPSATKNPAE